MYKKNEQNEVPIFYMDDPDMEFSVNQIAGTSPEAQPSEENDDQNNIMETINKEESDVETSKFNQISDEIGVTESDVTDSESILAEENKENDNLGDASDSGEDENDCEIVDNIRDDNPSKEDIATAESETAIDKVKDNVAGTTIIKIKKNNHNKKDKKDKEKRTLCKLVKKDFVKEQFSDYQALVADPEYICKKCGRAAKDAASLCKPLPITKQYEETQNSRALPKQF